MSFITRTWENTHLPKAAAIVNAQEGVSLIVAVIVAYVAEEWLGRFEVVVCTTAAFITGLVILCFQKSSGLIIYPALLLLTLGKGGRSPTLKAFLRDQFLIINPNPNSSSEKEERSQNWEMAEARQQFWWRTAWFFGPIAATVISSILVMESIIIISSTITGGAFVLFLGGSRYYNKELPDCNSRRNNWRSLLRLVPVWLTFLMYCLVEAAGTTFFIEQSDNLEDQIGNVFQIPLAFFFGLQSLTCFVTSMLVDFIISKWANQEHQRKRASVVRIGVGMLVSFLCCLTAWQVEVSRLKLIKKYKFLDDGDDKKIPMNILWLTPQFLLLGLMAGLVEEGMENCFYHLVPEDMKLHELHFDQIVMGIGKFVSILVILIVCRGWFGDNSDESRLDRYFLMLAKLSIVSFTIFTIFAAYACCCWKIDPQDDLEQGTPSSDEPSPEIIETGFQPSTSQHLTEESSTGSLVEGAAPASPHHFLKQGESMATRPNIWNIVRQSIRLRNSLMKKNLLRLRNRSLGSSTKPQQ